MSKITYNADILKVMRLFESVTRTHLKDAFYDDNNLLTFVVQSSYVGKAIGKRAVNVKKLEQLLKKKVRIVGFDQNPIEFVKNLIYPIQADVIEEEGVICIKAPDAKTKGMLYGRNRANFNNTQQILNKYHKEQKIQVM